MKVAIYTRESGTCQYKPASPRAAYSPSTTFCLRYTEQSKRKWQQLDVKSYKEAQAASLKKLTELITETCKEKPDLGFGDFLKIESACTPTHEAPYSPRVS